MNLLDNIDEDPKARAAAAGSGAADAPGTRTAPVPLDLDLGFGESVPPAGGGTASSTPSAPAAVAVADRAMADTALPTGSIFTPPPLPAAGAAVADFDETRLEEPSARGVTGLRGLGGPAAGLGQRLFVGLVVVGLLVLLVTAGRSLLSVTRGSAQVAATGEALMHSQRLGRLVTQALQGSQPALAGARESAEVLGRTVRDLRTGSPNVAAVPADLEPSLQTLGPLVERAEANTATIVAQQAALVKAAAAVRGIDDRTGELLAAAEAVAAARGLGAAELGAASQLVMLTQRIARSADEFQSLEGVSPEAAFQLGRDLTTFRGLTDGLLNGSGDLRLTALRDPEARDRVTALVRAFEPTRIDATAILDNARGLAAAREAHGAILADSEPLREALAALQARLQADSAVGPVAIGLMLAALTALLFGAAALVQLYARDQRRRAEFAESQRHAAETEQREARRVNDANQAAILRLMNELQTVAEGDLTQQATVTEDITGAIADSVNYTVEELRSLVVQVKDAAGRVALTTEQVEATSTELLAASSEQLREIRETGESVLRMAGRINAVSAQAQETAEVARQSRVAAESGLRAVQDTIDGMNAIRDQIQDTAKRIKRLGESSQEIGEITELISDITEQTNVLALNAAIQAAAAGEAGRGFSVVAEEVQRLAERSADATRQIAALVKAIQTDTQDAVAAMERSTQGVISGARLSDNAGAALADIDGVSRRLDDLIARISAEATREAESANVVAANIQHIFAVAEQAGDGTRSTAAMVRELSKTAEDLRQSVERFRVA